jgi:hypothetical protein
MEINPLSKTKKGKFSKSDNKVMPDILFDFKKIIVEDVPLGHTVSLKY